MKFSGRIRVVPMDGCDGEAPEFSVQGTPSYRRLAAPLRAAILRSRQHLLAEQHLEGYWEGELEGDTILESEFILLWAFLGREKEALAKKAAGAILRKQLSTGGWALYPGGSVEISASVKAYFALKLTGHDPSAEAMQRARAAILKHGGADAVNSFTRFYLALLGQISYEQCPAVPPEFVLLPKWLPINLYAVSAWSRTILVPLSIMSALRPVRRLEPQFGIRELFLKHPQDWPALRCPGMKASEGWLSWERFFRGVDRTLKFLTRKRLLPLRKRAIKAATKWMVERFEGSDGLGAIFPPMVWSIIALWALGYDDDSREVRYCHERLQGLVIEDEDSARLQPCKSPVWDTAITLRALADSGLEAGHPAVRSAVDWLLEKEIRCRGDWAETVRAEPGGWCFEHENQFYPDVDDTAMVLMALRGVAGSDASGDSLPPALQVLADDAADMEETPGGSTSDRLAAACRRGERWMLALQNRDGGWGAFDRDNDREFLCRVPFADHNAMIDPSTPDLTGRVLEALGLAGKRIGDACVDKAVAYLRRTQEADGSWFGRWGVNYIYGTWQVLLGLRAVGVSTDDPAVAAGAQWLLAYQQPSGGWGESPDSYEHPHLRGQGPTTASQTAWAIMGLIAAGMHRRPAVARGVQYLLKQQRTDGGWDEPEFTGAGFPRVFYLRYHMYRLYFPLMALSRWAVAIGASLEEVVSAGRKLIKEEVAAGT